MVSWWISLIIAALLAALIEAVLHWFPWPRVIGQELGPPATYVVGMAPILIVFGLWTQCVVALPDWMATMGLTAITGAAGAAVIAGYGVDRHFARRMERRVRRGNDIAKVDCVNRNRSGGPGQR